MTDVLCYRRDTCQPTVGHYRTEC